MTSRQVGIPFARDAHGRRFDRSAIDRDPEPYVEPLYCDGCGVQVGPVHCPPHTVGGKVTTKSSHYRKYPGRHHTPGCRFDFERQAQNLIVECRGHVIKRGEEYRLLLPEDGAPQPAVPADGGRPRDAEGAHLEVLRADRTLLGEAVASARRIAQLLQHFDHDPAAIEHFRAEYRGQVISWPQFFYTGEQVVELAERLLTGGLTHPVAVAGAVHRHGTATSGSSFFVADQAVSVRVGGRRIKVEATVWTKARTVHDDLVSAGSWLGFGRWELFPRRAPTPRWVQLWAHRPWNCSTGLQLPADMRHRVQLRPAVPPQPTCRHPAAAVTTPPALPPATDRPDPPQGES